MRTSSRLTLSTAILTLCSVTTPSFAQKGGDRFRSFDKDGDGKVSRVELGDDARFKQFDKDNDGFVTMEEAIAALRGGKGKAAKSANPAPASASVSTTAPKSAAVEIEKLLDIRYAEAPGVDGKLLSLDIYKAKNAKNAPVMVYVHGGGWKAGDKQAVGAKPDFFTSQGFILVSVNYRLVPQVDVLTQLQDTANAIGWLHSHIAEHGGDPSRIHISGHSAGAHHVAIVGTNERFLKAAGKDLSIIKSVLVLDTQALDVKRLMASDKGAAAYDHAFGRDEKIWTEISPMANVAKDKYLPPFIISYSYGTEQANTAEPRKLQADAFSQALTAVGIRNQVVPAIDRSHGEINARFGTAEDNVTQAVMRFLDAK